MKLGLEHSYADLPGCGVETPPRPAPMPGLLFWNGGLSRELELPLEGLPQDTLAAIFSGNSLPEDAKPFAQGYAGHQFGNFSPQLGDGRALLLGERVLPDGRRFDIAFKGSGRTPFSRGGDGLAAVGPMLREALVSESMHALGIPTTRALAVVATGETVRREILLPGAVLTRVASSHIRVGTFEYFAFRGRLDTVRLLADHAILRHDPELAGQNPGLEVPDGRYLAFLQAVADRQARLIAQWMNVGFIHGVMNTDNMTVSGETIDYGPCAFLEGYDPATVFSSIDYAGRYAYGNQPGIGQWNLARLAEALLPLLSPDEDEGVRLATGLLEAWPKVYAGNLHEGRMRKLGLSPLAGRESEDIRLGADFLSLLQDAKADFTLSWRHLGAAATGDEEPLRALFPDREMPTEWLLRWRERCGLEDGEQDPQAAGRVRREAMDLTNPVMIARNHRVEEALAAATDGDLAPFARLLRALKQPYAVEPGNEDLTESAPAAVTACYKTFCGT